MHLRLLPAGLAALNLLGASMAVASPSPGPAQGDPVRGQALYGVCMSCHSLDDNDVGPKHRGVVGRRAGIVPGYHYSTALLNSGVVWTPANLDRWLSGPQAFVPGVRMYFSLSDAQKRADIIAYLAQQK